MPLLHENDAFPVDGPVESMTVGEVVPLVTVPVMSPLQVLPPTVQATGPVHDAKQVAPPFCVTLPLLQVNVDEPVVGCVESVITGEVAPLPSAAGKVPLQVFPLAVQLTAPAQDCEQVAPAV